MAVLAFLVVVLAFQALVVVLVVALEVVQAFLVVDQAFLALVADLVVVLA